MWTKSSMSPQDSLQDVRIATARTSTLRTMTDATADSTPKSWSLRKVTASKRPALYRIQFQHRAMAK